MTELVDIFTEWVHTDNVLIIYVSVRNQSFKLMFAKIVVYMVGAEFFDHFSQDFLHTIDVKSSHWFNNSNNSFTRVETGTTFIRVVGGQLTLICSTA